MEIAKKIHENQTIESKSVVQNLWAGYGELYRCVYKGETYVVKEISFPNNIDHSRGWNTNAGDLRKRKSYQVEIAFYQVYSTEIGKYCRLPKFIDCDESNSGMTLVLEDLKKSGFKEVKMNLKMKELETAISWLAKFHAVNMNKDFPELWEEGSYWYLDTRKEEFDRMEDGKHKQKAREWSDILKNCKYQTLLHGDAKYANFLWSDNGEIAAVDFQYVGKGCGMKDLVYLLSCDSSDKTNHDKLIEYYFKELDNNYQGSDFKEIKEEWEPMFEIARKDFERFLIGWSPGHWKLD